MSYQSGALNLKSAFEIIMLPSKHCRVSRFILRVILIMLELNFLKNIHPLFLQEVVHAYENKILLGSRVML